MSPLRSVLLAPDGVEAPIELAVEDRLQDVGRTALEIKGLALAHRSHFVEARDGVVRRMLVVQLESFLPSNDEAYRYPLPDPVTLGGATWGSWVFCYSVAQEMAEDPAAETADTVRHLEARGLRLEDEADHGALRPDHR